MEKPKEIGRIEIKMIELPNHKGLTTSGVQVTSGGDHQYALNILKGLISELELVKAKLIRDALILTQEFETRIQRGQNGKG